MKELFNKLSNVFQFLKENRLVCRKNQPSARARLLSGVTKGAKERREKHVEDKAAARKELEEWGFTEVKGPEEFMAKAKEHKKLHKRRLEELKAKKRKERAIREKKPPALAGGERARERLAKKVMRGKKLIPEVKRKELIKQRKLELAEKGKRLARKRLEKKGATKEQLFAFEMAYHPDFRKEMEKRYFKGNESSVKPLDPKEVDTWKEIHKAFMEDEELKGGYIAEYEKRVEKKPRVAEAEVKITAGAPTITPGGYEFEEIDLRTEKTKREEEIARLEEELDKATGIAAEASDAAEEARRLAEEAKPEDKEKAERGARKAEREAREAEILVGVAIENLMEAEKK